MTHCNIYAINAGYKKRAYWLPFRSGKDLKTAAEAFRHDEREQGQSHRAKPLLFCFFRSFWHRSEPRSTETSGKASTFTSETGHGRRLPDPNRKTKIKQINSINNAGKRAKLQGEGEGVHDARRGEPLPMLPI